MKFLAVVVAALLLLGPLVDALRLPSLPRLPRLGRGPTQPPRAGSMDYVKLAPLLNKNKKKVAQHEDILPHIVTDYDVFAILGVPSDRLDDVNDLLNEADNQAHSGRSNFEMVPSVPIKGKQHLFVFNTGNLKLMLGYSATIKNVLHAPFTCFFSHPRDEKRTFVYTAARLSSSAKKASQELRALANYYVQLTKENPDTPISFLLGDFNSGEPFVNKVQLLDAAADILDEGNDEPEPDSVAEETVDPYLSQNSYNQEELMRTFGEGLAFVGERAGQLGQAAALRAQQLQQQKNNLDGFFNGNANEPVVEHAQIMEILAKMMGQTAEQSPKTPGRLNPQQLIQNAAKQILGEQAYQENEKDMASELATIYDDLAGKSREAAADMLRRAEQYVPEKGKDASGLTKAAKAAMLAWLLASNPEQPPNVPSKSISTPFKDLPKLPTWLSPQNRAVDADYDNDDEY